MTTDQHLNHTTQTGELTGRLLCIAKLLHYKSNWTNSQKKVPSGAVKHKVNNNGTFCFRYKFVSAYKTESISIGS